MKLKFKVNRKGKRAVHRKTKHGKWSTSMVKTSKFNFKQPSPWLVSQATKVAWLLFYPPSLMIPTVQTSPQPDSPVPFGTGCAKVERIAMRCVASICVVAIRSTLAHFCGSQMEAVASSFEAKVQKIAKIYDYFFDYCLRSSALLIDLWDYLGYDYIGSLCPKFRADLFDIVGDFFLISISLKENCYD